MHRDALGTAILLGMGGVTAELFKDTTMRLLPEQGGLSRGEALAMAQDLKTWPLLDGLRGRPKGRCRCAGRCDRRVLGDDRPARRSARRGRGQPGLRLPQGQGVRAADGVVVLA
jgi:hypothetical protein